MEMTTKLRHAELSELAQVLKSQSEVKYDVVAHSNDLRFTDGNLVITGGDQALSIDGVTTIDTTLRPTAVFDEGIADKLNIPIKYLRKMRDDNQPGLLDHNVNTWLDANQTNWFVRGFKEAGSDEPGIGRAFLSDQYRVIDNYDALLAVLDGIRQTGTEIDVVGCDLSERRMSVKIAAPGISALAPILLGQYRSPFDDATPERAEALARHGWLRDDEAPVVFAGFEASNSETGGGAWVLKPRLIIKRCRNGLTVKLDQIRHVHLGSKMDQGIVRWSDETQKKNVELITAQTADAVKTFLDVDYIKAKLAEVEKVADHKVAKPVEVISKVSSALKFTKEEADGILDCFIKSGDTTAGGVMQAITAQAQLVVDPDRASVLEDAALEALSMAASS